MFGEELGELQVDNEEEEESESLLSLSERESESFFASSMTIFGAGLFFLRELRSSEPTCSTTSPSSPLLKSINLSVGAFSECLYLWKILRVLFASWATTLTAVRHQGWLRNSLAEKR